MEEKSREIGEAAREYVVSRPRSARPAVAPTVLLTVGAVLAVLSTAVKRLDWPVARTWQMALLLVSLVCYFGGGWMWIKRLVPGRRDPAEAKGSAGKLRWWFWLMMFVVEWASLLGAMWLALKPGMRASLDGRATILTVSFMCALAGTWVARRWMEGDWRGFLRRQMLSAQQDAGVVVQEPVISGEPKWWLVPLSLLSGPATLAVLALSYQAPLRFQPLVFAGGVTVFGVVVRAAIRAARGRQARPRRLWLFIGWGLYWGYAMAVAAGMPQPFARATEAWAGAAWAARLMLPLAVATIAQLIVGECYSRLQFRRLQRLVNEDPPQEGKGDA